MKSGDVLVDLFEREQKRERKERFLKLVAMSMLAMVVVSFGADDTGMIGSLGDVMNVVIPIIKYAASAILLIMFLTKLIPALTGNQKENVWWEIIGILAAVIAINTAETIFEKITDQKII